MDEAELRFGIGQWQRYDPPFEKCNSERPLAAWPTFGKPGRRQARWSHRSQPIPLGLPPGTSGGELVSKLGKPARSSQKGVMVGEVAREGETRQQEVALRLAFRKRENKIKARPRGSRSHRKASPQGFIAFFKLLFLFAPLTFACFPSIMYLLDAPCL